MTELQQAFVDALSKRWGEPDGVALGFPNGSLDVVYGPMHVTASGRELRMNAGQMDMLAKARLHAAFRHQPVRP